MSLVRNTDKRLVMWVTNVTAIIPEDTYTYFKHLLPGIFDSQEFLLVNITLLF